MALRPFIGGKATLWLPVPTGGSIKRPGRAVYGLPLWWVGCASHQPHEPVDHEGGFGLAAAVVPCGFVDNAFLLDWVFVLNVEHI